MSAAMAFRAEGFIACLALWLLVAFVRRAIAPLGSHKEFWNFGVILMLLALVVVYVAFVNLMFFTK